VVETAADERGGDAGAAADLEQAVAWLDGKRLDRSEIRSGITRARGVQELGSPANRAFSGEQARCSYRTSAIA
jgi:hypothetical protein